MIDQRLVDFAALRTSRPAASTTEMMWRCASMLVSWSVGPRRTAKSPSDAGMLLTLLSRLGDMAHIGSFLAEVSAAGAYGRGDNEGVLQDSTAATSPDR
jgi:hypothetical protein